MVEYLLELAGSYHTGSHGISFDTYDDHTYNATNVHVSCT